MEPERSPVTHLAKGTLTLVCIRKKHIHFRLELGEAFALEEVILPDRILLWYSGVNRALDFVHSLVSRHPDSLCGGVSTGDTSSEEGLRRVSQEAAGAALIADAGEVLVCLSTQEIARSAVADHLKFYPLGLRELESGVKSRLFLLAEPDAAWERASFTPKSWTQPSFVGRTRELALLHDKYAHGSRFAVICGPSGIGKTALAGRFAAEVHGDSAERIRWVAMDEVYRPSQVLHRVASELEISYLDEAGIQSQIIREIADRDLMLVFDHIEGLFDPVMDLVQAILSSCRNVFVVATSAVRMATDWVDVVDLKGLDFPSPYERTAELAHYEAMQLLMGLARRADPAYTVDEDSLRTLAAICDAVEGSPLNLKMVAARLGILSPRQVLSRLRDDPLGFLVDGQSAESSARAVLAATWSTLNPWSSKLFARLSIFSSCFDADAVEAVCCDELVPKGAVFDSLKDLLESYLIVASTRKCSKRMFRLTQICREFADGLLKREERRGLQTRLARYLKELERVHWPQGLTSSAQVLEVFDGSYEDLRQSWLNQVKTKSGANQAVESAAGAANFWFQRLHFAEGSSLVSSIASHPYATNSPKFVALINVGAWCNVKTGEYSAASRLVRTALRLALQQGSRIDVAKVLNTASAAYSDLCRPRSAIRCSRISLEIVTQENSPHLPILRANLAGLLTWVAKFDEAERLLRLNDREPHAASWSAVSHWSNWAHLEAYRGRWESARSYLAKACDLLHEYPYPTIVPTLYLTACTVALGEGRMVELSQLVGAVHGSLQHFGITAAPRQRIQLAQFEAEAGQDASGLTERWDPEFPLKLLEESLNQH